MSIAKLVALCAVTLLLSCVMAVEPESVGADSSRVETLTPILKADFVAKVTKGKQPLEVYFKDLTVPVNGRIVRWKWDFGDSLDIIDTGIYTRRNPLYTYINPGLYTVSLTVTDAADSLATVQKIDYITVKQGEGEMLTKIALSTFPTQGLRLGFQVAESKHFMTFLNLDLMTLFTVSNSFGANVEFGRHKYSGPYVLLSGGLELVLVQQIDWWGKTDATKSEFMPYIIPHLTAGIGWQFKFQNGNWFYVEADFGWKNFLGGIYLGVMF